ncbi:MAG: tetraacyldisaccharide 4'-kinase [Pirellulaceae bacterium]
MSRQRRDPLALAIRCATRIASYPYGAVVRLRNRRYDRGKAPIGRADVPVISVGNITTGGTGKSPMVAWIARLLRDEGLRVALISRGYGAAAGMVNDEALELEERLPDVPHVQNPDRVQAAAVVVEELETEVILLDDGFQHRRLHRDLDIVLIDATCPFGYQALLPRGLLREPLSSLKRADVVVLTRSDAVSDDQRDQIQKTVSRYATNATWVSSVHAPSRLRSFGNDDQPLETIANQEVLVFSAIGNPSAFSQTVRQCGAKIVAEKQFPDHHRYNRNDIETLIAWAGRYPTATSFVCTHKDLVKLKADRLGRLPLFAICIDMQITEGEEALRKQILSIARR